MDVLCEEINYTDDAKKVLKTYSPCTQHKKATPHRRKNKTNVLIIYNMS
jgi:hypothetical protein